MGAVKVHGINPLTTAAYLGLNREFPFGLSLKPLQIWSVAYRNGIRHPSRHKSLLDRGNLLVTQISVLNLEALTKPELAPTTSDFFPPFDDHRKFLSLFC